ncbi:MAG: TIGR00159 family protein [Candidatus Omnitrophica bacterium]|nr:TIGR00159 family protein [Candidatus Omnitrophota bacterium]
MIFPIGSIAQIAKSLIEIMILWAVYYRVLLFFEGTRAFQVLKGIAYLTIALLVSQVCGFEVLNWLLKNFFSIWIIVIVVIFQHELRSGLARLGQQHLFSISLGEVEIKKLIEEIADAVYRLSKYKIGCLIALEREMKLSLYIESGVALDAKVSSPLVQSLFMNTSPLHDGGMVIRGERIEASSCLFPLSENPSVSKTVGTRHRAALGLSEQTDALIVLVSEQSGDVSLAFEGRFIQAYNQEHFVNLLRELLVPAKAKKQENRLRR